MDSDGSQLGVMPPQDAVARAVDLGLDLVEVAPNAAPPVCRIMDYGKYKYEKKKKGGSRAKTHAASTKEVKLRPRTDDHDLDFKLRNARRFLGDGDKVKITLAFRGREIVHSSLGRVQLAKVQTLLEDIATVENPPRLDGRFMSMILVPKREAVQAQRRAETAETAETAEAADGADAVPTVGGGRGTGVAAAPSTKAAGAAGAVAKAADAGDGGSE